jgi:hypothetical protein
MVVATTAVLGLALGAYQASESASAARAQNKAIERSMESEQRVAAIKTEQVANQAEIEKRKITNRAAQIRGRIRVAAADSGFGLGGSTAALARQSAFDESINSSIVDRNVLSQNELIASGLQAHLESLASNSQNEMLAAFMGGLSGLDTGLSLGQGIGSIDRNRKTPKLKAQQFQTPTLTTDS